MSRQLRPLGLSHTVQVLLSNINNTSFNFSDSVLLLDKVLVHAIFITTDQSKSQNFGNVLPIAKIREGYISLAGYNNEFYNTRLPLSFWESRTGYLEYSPTGRCNTLFFKPRLLSIRNSFIEFPSIASWVLPDGGYTVPLTFFYEKYDTEKHELNSWGELINDTN